MSCLLFVHIPKNAGSSVIASIPGLNFIDHFPIRHPGSDRIDYKRMNIMRKKPMFRGYRSFAVKRNPYDRFISAYSYLYNGGNGSKLDMDARNVIRSYHDVNDFVDDLRIHMERIIHFVPQHVFICKNGKILVNEILAFEDLATRPMSVYGYPLIHVNRSSRDGVSLTPASMKIIREYYKDDFEIFGYDFSIENR